jgi:hypothetical protein
VLAAVAENPRTAIVLAPDGRVAELVPLAAAPSAEAFIALTRTRVPGTRFRLVPQAHLSEAQLEALLSEMAARPVPDSSPGPSIADPEPRIYEFAAARAIAEAIAKWMAR